MQYHQTLLEKYGTKAAAARAAGIAVTTFKDRLSRELAQRPAGRTISTDHIGMHVPALEEVRPSITEILAQIERNYEDKKSTADERHWFPVKMMSNKPVGLMVWGDPHLDSPGCDIPLLRHHMRLAAHPGVVSINIGDTLDGWVGRLARLYADSRVDVHTARELAQWFLREVRWLLWIAGNHDSWADNQTILRLMSKQEGVALLDWEAKFKLCFPNGTELLVHAAHDFPGRSIHNVVHGPMRASRFSSPADLFLAGHIHQWGSSVFEMTGFDRTPHSVRVRGYKTIDKYATQLGYQSAKHGASCLIIIDPNVEGPGRILPCWDIAQGVDMLDALLQRYKGDRS